MILIFKKTGNAFSTFKSPLEPELGMTNGRRVTTQVQKVSISISSPEEKERLIPGVFHCQTQEAL